MTKKPQSFNINKTVGQLNLVRDLSGRLVERTEYVYVKFGEDITFVKAFYDPDHFIYQNVMPISEIEVRIKYMGNLPKELQGSNIMCTCGAEGVIATDGELAGMAICKSLATVGKHQTSFKIQNGTLVYDKKTKDDFFLTDSELKKSMKSKEQAADEATDSNKNNNKLDNGLE